MAPLLERSEVARQLSTIIGFGQTSAAELAGEIGTLDRFGSEASLALYLGMCPLDNRSGQSQKTKNPRQVNWRGKAAMWLGTSTMSLNLGRTMTRSVLKGRSTTRRSGLSDGIWCASCSRRRAGTGGRV